MIGKNYSMLALRLGLQQCDIEAAQYNWPRDLHSLVMDLLRKWKQTTGEADRNTVVRILKELGPSNTKLIHLLTTGEEDSLLLN